MNVTIKVDDQLCRAARHRAVDAGLSLSGWISELLRKELAGEQQPETLLEALGCGKHQDIEFDVPRDGSGLRPVNFS